jgi:uncharacterized membrane protein YwzB
MILSTMTFSIVTLSVMDLIGTLDVMLYWVWHLNSLPMRSSSSKSGATTLSMMNLIVTFSIIFLMSNFFIDMTSVISPSVVILIVMAPTESNDI